ncbi:hypothetical protein PHMEG_0003420 [Phytophthora megakarya]|uniref:Chromo domain-containing protein n=1 Tax=Phytophthora megakarya TaxID=4795 RepID=A0A225WW63_9STRA|nr:hypothetical protein PHMEG_0003420 [Phytophthora megakarya]
MRLEFRVTLFHTPWLTGTAERVNKDLLQVFRTLLLECELDTTNWVYLVPLVQFNLHHTPVRSFRGKSPVDTGFTREHEHHSKNEKECTFSFDVHTIRLKHYADDMLEVSEELKHHIALQGIKVGVRVIPCGRYHGQAKELQALVSWQGLEEVEKSWESLASIYAAMPDQVKQYVETSTDSWLKKHVKKMQENRNA